MTSALKLHPACACYDVMSEAELDDLARDINERGLLEPITIMPDGAILDGRNRRLACERVGAPPRTVVYSGDDPIGFVLSKNERRRHLPAARRALIAARLANLQQDGDRKKIKTYAGCLISHAAAAEKFDVSLSTVDKAVVLLRDGAAHIVEMVEREEVGLATAAEAVRNLQRSHQEGLRSGADVKRALAARRVANSRCAAPSAPRPRLNALTMVRPPYRHLGGEDSGMPPKEVLGQQAPGEPAGVTVAIADTRANGHVQLWTPTQAEQLDRRRRFQELTVRITRLDADDLPEPSELALLDPKEAERVRQQLRKHLASIQARLATFAALIA
jgi:ParB-like chromosome segregation protein Spo0J